MRLLKQTVLFTLVFSFFLVPPLYADEISPEEIIKKSNTIYRGNDSVSKLTFLFRRKGEPDSKMKHTMVWKDYKGKDGFDSKIIFFQEFPPDAKGIAYMAWVYKTELNKESEEWLYLPDLRKVRRLSHRKEKDPHEDDGFAKSELHSQHLVPRPAYLDSHKLIKTEKIDGETFYIIESIPKKEAVSFPYSQTISMISKENFLRKSIDYYRDGKLELKQGIHWLKIDDAWVWDRVTAVNVQNGNDTVLNISGIKINVGLKDNAFSKRMLKLGSDRF